MKDFKKSVVYQIYPKSFSDSNGDGIGDIKGVTGRLNYLQYLGVDYIWLTPFYISPQRDNGYDVADYRNIDPIFGTMEDFEELISEAKERNIQIMLDMVFNHTSTEHNWFRNALAGDEKYRDYYIFKEPVDGMAPTNWESKFGGSAWEYVKELDMYYLHLFDRTQADLNWENPQVRNEMYDIVNYWAEKGVKGFRFDVVNLISKPEKYENDYDGDGRRFYTDGPKIHDYLKGLNENSFGRHEGVITVGEMSSTSIKNCIRYSNPDEKELSMVFSFHHLKVDYKNGDKWTLMDFDFFELKRIINNWQIGMENGSGWNALFWCNHDQPRVVSRFGDDKKYLKESAKMLGTAMHMLRGTPYIYQGEEIGMTNAYFESIEEYRDVESVNYYSILQSQGKSKDEITRILQSKSRDNSRTPMQWSNEENCGFTEGIPWMPLGRNKHIDVEAALMDEGSIFYHYKELISLRKNNDVIAYGTYEPLLENNPQIFSYIRKYKNQKLIVLNNFYGKETKIDLTQEVNFENYTFKKILISNYENSSENMEDIILRPYESVVYLLEK
ncbi:MAG: alpha,alpha-phosphotrehalase [Clostridiaceae bacterium]